MTGNRRSARARQNVVIGSGNITGKVADSQVSIVTGDGGMASNEQIVSAAAQVPWLDQLRDELARICVLLEGDHSSAVSADDRDDAVDAVRDLQTEVADAQNAIEADPKGFRWRVRALLGVLAPVAEVIGGVAALEAILSHL